MCNVHGGRVRRHEQELYQALNVGILVGANATFRDVRERRVEESDGSFNSETWQGQYFRAVGDVWRQQWWCSRQKAPACLRHRDRDEPENRRQQTHGERSDEQLVVETHAELWEDNGVSGTPGADHSFVPEHGTCAARPRNVSSDRHTN